MAINGGAQAIEELDPPAAVPVVDARTSRYEVSPLLVSAERYRLIVESATDYAIVTTDLDGRITTLNSGAERLLGYADNEIIGRDASIFFTPDDRDNDRLGIEMRCALEEGRAVNERWHQRKDGSRFFASGLMMPLKDDAGVVLGFSTILRDRTAEHKAEVALRKSEALARSLFHSSADCVKILDLEGRLLEMNVPGQALLEIDDLDIFIGQRWALLWPEALRPDVSRALDEARAGRVGRFYGCSPTALGTEKWWDVMVSPILGPEGQPQLLLSVSRDMTERRRAEEHRSLLINELNHRVKNTLATVQAIAYQTWRAADVDPKMLATFEARLLALASAHDVLTKENWSGAHLGDIVEVSLRPYASAPSKRFDVEGPDVLLTPKAALAIAMALQELATNAAKYGALSRNYGRVSVHWKTVEVAGERRLQLRWTESGGPPVAPPQQKGFGSRLIERSLGIELDGKAEIDFQPTGVVCTIEASLPTISDLSVSGQHSSLLSAQIPANVRR